MKATLVSPDLRAESSCPAEPWPRDTSPEQPSLPPGLFLSHTAKPFHCCLSNCHPFAVSWFVLWHQAHPQGHHSSGSENSLQVNPAGAGCPQPAHIDTPNISIREGCFPMSQQPRKVKGERKSINAS